MAILKKSEELEIKMIDILGENMKWIILPDTGVYEIHIHALFFFMYGAYPKNFYTIRANESGELMALDCSEKMPDDDAAKGLRNAKIKFEYLSTVRKMNATQILVNSDAYYPTDKGLLVISTHMDFNGINTITSAHFYSLEHDCAQDVTDTVSAYFVPMNHVEDNANSYLLAVQTMNGIGTKKFKFNDWHCDINKNYNDDLPYERINKLLRTDNAELILLYGEPGTGKSSLIKTIINESCNAELKFIYFDSNLMKSASDSKLLQFLMDNKGAVIILEDCEKLLAKREDGNPFMNTVLNLTDGIIGESFAVKFLCTFNCPLARIDEALLRKGRLSLKYEFKKLAVQKAKALINTADGDMTLADIYNNEENDFSKNNGGKIGF